MNCVAENQDAGLAADLSVDKNSTKDLRREALSHRDQPARRAQVLRIAEAKSHQRRKSAAVAQSPQSRRGQAGSSRRKVRASGTVLPEAIKSSGSTRPSPTRGESRQVSLQVPRVVGATSRQVSHQSARAAKDGKRRTQVLSSPRPKVGRQVPAQQARALSGEVLAEAPKSSGSTRHPGDRTINTYNK